MKKIVLSHSDPFNTGRGIRMIYHPIMDGPLHDLVKAGWKTEVIDIEEGSRAYINRYKVFTVKNKNAIRSGD